HSNQFLITRLSVLPFAPSNGNREKRAWPAPRSPTVVEIDRTALRSALIVDIPLPTDPSPTALISTKGDRHRPGTLRGSCGFQSETGRQRPSVSVAAMTRNRRLTT